jgi:hypothetical protein
MASCSRRGGDRVSRGGDLRVSRPAPVPASSAWATPAAVPVSSAWATPAAVPRGCPP